MARGRNGLLDLSDLADLVIVETRLYKKVLRERKRHTTRRVATASPCYSGGGERGGPSTKIFFSSMNMYQAKSAVKKFSLYLDWVPPPVQGWIGSPPHQRLDWDPPPSKTGLGPPPLSKTGLGPPQG